MSKKILITGGSGFVGSNLAIGLKKKWPDANIVALDNLRRRGSELSLKRLRDFNVQFMHGDVRNPADLEDCEDVDLIIECSAEPSVLAGVNSSPRYLVDSNLVGAINCFELGRKSGATIIFLSSSRVYPYESINELPYRENETRFVWDDSSPGDINGWSENGIREDFPLEGKRSLYGATKLSAELIAQEYAEAYDLNIIINRCGVLAGPWQYGKLDQGVFALWVFNHLFGKNLSYIGFGGLGKQVRDLLHIEDLTDLVISQVENPNKSHFSTFNVGGGKNSSLSLSELTSLCQDITKKTVSIHPIIENRPFDLPIYITDNNKISNVYNWAPKRPADTTIFDIFEWACEYKDDLASLI